MDGRPNRRNKAVLSNFSGTSWTLLNTSMFVMVCRSLCNPSVYPEAHKVTFIFKEALAFSEQA